MITRLLKAKDQPLSRASRAENGNAASTSSSESASSRAHNSGLLFIVIAAVRNCQVANLAQYRLASLRKTAAAPFRHIAALQAIAQDLAGNSRTLLADNDDVAAIIIGPDIAPGVIVILRPTPRRRFFIDACIGWSTPGNRSGISAKLPERFFAAAFKNQKSSIESTARVSDVCLLRCA